MHDGTITLSDGNAAGGVRALADFPALPLP
jgi:hypothetical protein